MCGFFRTCVTVHGCHKLQLPDPTAHATGPLLAHLREHDVLVSTSWCLTSVTPHQALQYVYHTSDLQCTTFVCGNLAEKTCFGHIIVLPLHAISAVPNLWLIPVSLIPLGGGHTKLIYDYNFSGINSAVILHPPPPLAIRFGGKLRRLLSSILNADTTYSPVFVSKVNLINS